MPSVKTHILLIVIISFSAAAEKSLNIAVASNFVETMRRIVTAYTAQTGEQVNLLTGSTGKHYLQITYGAPIDLFFSADQKRPQRLFEQGKASKPFTYAVGTLGYWMPSYSGPNIGFKDAISLPAERVVIANPKHAPYGMASQRVLQRLAVWGKGNNESRYVFAENINQSYTFVRSKSVNAGFVAYAQLKQAKVSDKEYWIVPRDYYPPIKQDAVIIHPSQQAKDFLSFFKTKQVQTLLEADGYQLP